MSCHIMTATEAEKKYNTIIVTLQLTLHEGGCAAVL